MKHLKKLIAAALTLVMALAVSTTAWAATHTISVAEGDTHEYKVFQVLTGELTDPNSTKTLTNVAWGADATAAAKATDPDDFIESLAGLSEQDVATTVASKVNTSGDGCGIVKAGSPIEGLATGYYVLVDVTDLTNKPLETKSLNVVKVVNDIQGFTKKWDTTTDTKVITSDTLGKDNATKDNNNIDPDGDKDNVSVGDVVNYQITTKVPANADKYNYFYFVINDTLSKGLTFNNDVVVYKGSISESNKLTAGTDYALRVKGDNPDTEDGHTFEVGLLDAKNLAGTDIIVVYSATLNSDAVIGEPGNPNTSTVDFSRDPNHDYDGKNYPGFPADKEDDAMGETPITETITYTTGIEIQKVDQDGKVLTGATFEISGDSVQTVLTVAETFTAGTGDEYVYWKLKDGTYTKTAPTATGDYMVEAEAGASAGYVEDSSYDGNDKVVVDGKTYRPYVAETDAGKTIYTKVTGNGHLYDSTETKYKKELNKTTVDGAANDYKVEKAVDANGLVRFDGLGAGTYKIHESVTPSGYNTVEDLTVTVTFDEDGDPKYTFSGGNGAWDGAEGIYKITVENNKGTELPETGGMGTTILYVIGGLMVAGGVITLITKQRMSQIQG